MAVPPVVDPLTNLQNESSAVAKINQNAQRAADAISKSLSTTDTTQNTMNVSLDMNGQRILNLPYPSQAGDPIRYQDREIFRGLQGIPGPPGPPGTNALYLNGFIGDGSLHPLSEKFSSLALAQLVYPKATALTNQIDGLALQKTIDQQAASGRVSIVLPACRAFTTNEIDFTGVNGKLRGSGPLVSILEDIRPGAKTTIRQGSETAGQPFPLIIEDMYFLNSASDTTGSIGFFIRHNQNAGVLQALCFRNVIFHKYAINHLYNVGRGLDFNNVVIFGPDFAKQANGAVTIRGTAGNTWGMFSHRYYNCLFANYRWGWDYQVSNCTVEGQAFSGCSAYNGDGLINVNCNGLDTNGNPGYKCLLWSFDNCDWEGLAYAIQMKNCRNIKVSAGFYIFARPYIAATDVIYKPDNTPAAQGTGRSMFNFIGCTGFSLQDVEMAAINLKDSFLVDVDATSDTGKFEDTVVRAYGADTAVCGFRLSGASRNTIIEKNTKWLGWPGGPKVFAVGTGDNYKQISYTEAAAANGAVTDDGFYSFAGVTTVTTDSTSKATINYPTRSNGQTFFALPPLVVLTPENNNNAVGAVSIASRTVNGVTFYGPGANVTFALDYLVFGRV